MLTLYKSKPKDILTWYMDFLRKRATHYFIFVYLYHVTTITKASTSASKYPDSIFFLFHLHLNILSNSADFDYVLGWLLWLIVHFTTTCCLQTYFLFYYIILILQKAKVRIAFFVLTVIEPALKCCWHFLWNGNLRFQLDLIPSVSQKGRKVSLISIPFIILI